MQLVFLVAPPISLVFSSLSVAKVAHKAQALVRLAAAFTVLALVGKVACPSLLLQLAYISAWVLVAQVQMPVLPPRLNMVARRVALGHLLVLQMPVANRYMVVVVVVVLHIALALRRRVVLRVSLPIQQVVVVRQE